MYKSKIAYRPLEQMTNKVSKLRFIPSAQIAAILLLAAVFCQSCSQVTENNPSVPNADKNYKIEIIDSCEYIVRENGMTTFKNYSFSITHKGNCKYCAARKSSK